MKTRLTALILASATIPASAATWEEQAARLQLVSATLLDSLPDGEPPPGQRAAAVRSTVSFLPKVDPTVGGKSEDVPSAPVHTVPTVAFHSAPAIVPGGRVQVSPYVGYLPPGGEKALGLSAKATQSLAGAALGFRSDGPVTLFAAVGAQRTDARVTGAITAPEADDSFEVRTTAVWLTAGAERRVGPWRLFTSVTAGSRRSHSVFEIPADATRFELEETPGDTGSGWRQIAAGADSGSGPSLSVAYLQVPGRLRMPRVTGGYKVVW